MTYYSGIAGETTATPTNLAPVDAVVAFLKAHSLNTWRVVFLPAFKADASSPYNKAIVQRFLDTFPEGIIIVDPYTVTGGDTVALHPTLWADLNAAALQVCRDFPNNPRVFVEIINEYYAADLYTQCQKILDNIRAAGYTNTIGINSISQMPQNLNDPLNKVSYSYHFYMNLFAPSGVMTKIAQMQALGQSIISTECGADAREIGYFTAAEIAALENTLSQMQAKGAGFTLWLMRDLINWTGIAPTWKNTTSSYSALGFVFPTGTPPPPPPPSASIAVSGTASGAPVTFQCWYDTQVPVPVVGSFTFPNVGLGPHTVHAVYGSQPQQDKNVTLSSQGEIASVTFDFTPPVTYIVDIWPMTGGTTTPTGTQTVTSGTNVTITAIANAGYTFQGWLVNGVANSANPLNLTITGPTTVIPQFQAIPVFTIGIMATQGGTTTPVPGTYQAASGSLTISAIASPGYIFQNWLVDGATVTTPSVTVQYNANHQVQAVFLPAVGTIEVHAYSAGLEVNASVIVGTQTQQTPFSIQVTAGSLSLTCTYQGNSLTQNVTVNVGQTTKVSFNFTPVAAAGVSGAAVAGVVILGIVGALAAIA